MRIRGVEEIDVDVEYAPSEDPIEAMSLLTAAVVTKSELTITRCPIEFLEIELAILSEMGLDFDLSPEYVSHNGFTRLVDVTVRPSKLRAVADKIHPMPSQAQHRQPTVLCGYCCGGRRPDPHP
ncbi:UDP-N-acetylglucosamine 1-carboxyvinyltransferase [Cutibacterium acnes JCM 18909]|nr:UDP-N-acetylglucosamine 1-carboxyvinyltransferase [Cutibacterium acnes JCM 18909]